MTEKFSSFFMSEPSLRMAEAAAIIAELGEFTKEASVYRLRLLFPGNGPAWVHRGFSRHESFTEIVSILSVAG